MSLDVVSLYFVGCRQACLGQQSRTRYFSVLLTRGKIYIRDLDINILLQRECDRVFEGELQRSGLCSDGLPKHDRSEEQRCGETNSISKVFWPDFINQSASQEQTVTIN